MRKEKDFLGELDVPDEALYGIHTLRALHNFPVGERFQKEWYQAMGVVKQACYLTVLNFRQAIITKTQNSPARMESFLKKLNLQDAEIFENLTVAAESMASGNYFDHFMIPSVSGGAGTSINMNINEILANVALLEKGLPPGNYSFIDPVEHANIFQSTNDVVPTALKVALMGLLTDLESQINHLRSVVEQHEKNNHLTLRIGYTQMQEAVPTSFGKLFSTYNEALSRDWWRVSKCFERIKLVNLGGGALGTGLAIPRYFIMEVVNQLRKLTDLPIARSENLADATSNLDSFVEIHATLKAHAVNLEKIVSDLRLLASDFANPQLSLPQAQVGSSIMPGKINPVIPEFVISIAHKIYANDQLISGLSAQGCLELNAYLPVIGHALIDSLKLLIAADKSLGERLFNGLTINKETSRNLLLKSPSVTTLLNPLIGYHKASELARFMKNNQTDILSANAALGFLPGDILVKLFEPENLLKLGFVLDDLEA